jgi:hypothetical protein
MKKEVAAAVPEAAALREARPRWVVELALEEWSS